jgi:hypothetical protein
MQLLEYLMWTYGSSHSMNYWISVSAAWLLYLQPITSILMTSQRAWIHPLLLSYLGMGLTYILFTGKRDYEMHRGVDGHLVWGWMKKDIQTVIGVIIYMTFLVIPIILNKNWELFGLCFALFIPSIYHYYKYRTWGSMWCFFVNYAIVIVCILRSMRSMRAI